MVHMDGPDIFADEASALPYLPNMGMVAEAFCLMERHGFGAELIAAHRADKARAMGNARTFCHWRQIERLIVLLASERVVGTRH